MFTVPLSHLLRKILEVEAREYGRPLFFHDHAVVRTTGRSARNCERLRRDIQDGPEALEKNRLGFFVKDYFPESATGTISPSGETGSCLYRDDGRCDGKAYDCNLHEVPLV